MSMRTPRTFTEAWDKFRTNTLSFSLALSRTYDDYYFRELFNNYKRRRLIYVQKLDMLSQQKLGPDLSVANFTLRYCRGRIRDSRGNWIGSFRKLPQTYVPSFRVTGIVASDAGLITEGVDNFTCLEYLEYINISKNQRLDDFFCDQFSRQYRASTTLKEIDISMNPRISIYGLEALLRIPSLRILDAYGTQAADHEEVELFKMAALDERNCDVRVQLKRIDSK